MISVRKTRSVVLTVAVLLVAGTFLVRRLRPGPSHVPDRPHAKPTEQTGTPPARTPPPAPAAAAAARAPALAATQNTPEPAANAAPYRILRVIDERRTPTETEGRFTRTRLLETDFKYPLLRVEERIAVDPGDGSERVLSRSAMVADHLLIKFRKGTDEADIRAVNARYGGAVRRRMNSRGLYLIAFRNPSLDTVPEKVAAYSQNGPPVTYAEPDTLVSLDATIPNDQYFNSLWAMNNTGQTGGTPDADIDAPEAWDVSTGSRDVIVGIIDTGIDLDHVDLVSNIWTNPGEIPGNGLDDDGNGFIDDVHGWDFYNDDANPNDDNSHGSHVSGTIGAMGNNAAGVAGVVWRVRLMALKMIGGSGSGPISDAVRAIDYATMMRTNGIAIRVTNNSWGDSVLSSSLRDAIEANERAGMLFVCSAGNNGRNIDTGLAYYPSSFGTSNIVSVANTTHTDARRASSNYGAVSVDLGAPGTSILSTVPNNNYGYKTGTSMSTPHVVGAAAMIWGIRPDLTYRQVRDVIFAGADPIEAMAGITVTGGRLNLHGSLLQLPVRIVHEPHQNSTNTVTGYEIEASFDPHNLVDTNRVWLFWNTDGATNSFASNRLERATNGTYTATIPAQPLGTNIHYYLSAISLGDKFSVDPSNAPAALHRFEVVSGVALTVAGSPGEYGTVSPAYGTSLLASGVTVNASAPASTAPSNAQRYASLGWTGTNDVPAFGTSNQCSFVLNGPSRIEWQWTSQVALVQMSTVPGLLATTTWWNTSSEGGTVTAADTIALGSTNFAFAGWHLDGSRQPSATGVAVNPVVNIPMTDVHTGTAVYIDRALDLDNDALEDWWECFYFGSTNAAPGGDDDGDGFVNTNELADGTNPRDSGSFPRAPFIDHTALSSPRPVPAPWLVSASVTDNTAVAQVTLRWNRNGNGWTDTPMAPIYGGPVYTNSIPAPGTNGDSFAYVLEAQDTAGYTRTSATTDLFVAYPILEYSPTNLMGHVLMPNSVTSRTLRISNGGITSLTWKVRQGWADFVENGENGWSHGGLNDLWNISTDESYSPDHAWHCGQGIGSQYLPLMNASLYTPLIQVGTNSALTFRHWIDSELDLENELQAYDGGIVEISTNLGASFEQIFPAGGYPFTAHSHPNSTWTTPVPLFAGAGGWRKERFDLSAYEGREVIIRFRFGSDWNTQSVGWFIDDVTLGPLAQPLYWLNPLFSSGMTVPGGTNTVTITLNSTNIPTGERAAILQLVCSDESHATNEIPVTLSVRSPPRLALVSAEQTSTNGQGLVTISNTLYDVDQDPCDLEISYIPDEGAPWANAWIADAVSSLGDVILSNTTPRQARRVPTSNGAQADTNAVRLRWDTQGSPQPVLLSTNVRVRMRAWDGTYWSSPVTSQSFLVDNEAPSATGAVVTIFGSEAGDYAVGTTVSSAWYGFADRGIGLAGYYYSLTNESPAAGDMWTTSTTGALPAITGETNTVYVWARDAYGSIGDAASASMLVLDPTGDFDNDGALNSEEEVAGTDADNAASLFAIVSAASTASSGTTAVVLRWVSVSNRQYNLYYSPSLSNALPEWTHALTNRLGTGAFVSYTDTLDITGSRFYKLTVSPP